MLSETGKKSNFFFSLAHPQIIFFIFVLFNNSKK